jgi:hypothetical protein
MAMRRIGILIASLLVVLNVLSGVLTTSAHHAVLRFNLEEMTATADRIFVGRCIAVEETEELVAQGIMPVTRYSFEVERVLKGRLPRLTTFRQLGHPPRPASGKGGGMTMHGRAVTRDTFIHGMSEYRAGDRVVLFLIKNYLGDKVTYPVGLYQGAFFVSRMPSGQELARNSINNLGLFTAPYNGTVMRDGDARIIFPERDEPLSDAAGLTVKTRSLADKRGALPLDSLLQLVEQIIVAHGGEKGELVEGKKGAVLQ